MPGLEYGREDFVGNTDMAALSFMHMIDTRSLCLDIPVDRVEWHV